MYDKISYPMRATIVNNNPSIILLYTLYLIYSKMIDYVYNIILCKSSVDENIIGIPKTRDNFGKLQIF